MSVIRLISRLTPPEKESPSLKNAIAFTCAECTGLPPGYADPTLRTDSIVIMPYSQGPRYDGLCKYKHINRIYLEDRPFEVLFEIAAHAILDGYYREAVASFTSSLERFYEFAIRCFVKRHGIEPDVFSKSWNTVVKQSERQLGAFFYLWLSHFGTIPALLPTDKTTFRNKVIHQGLIPSREEAVSYGQVVLLLIRDQFGRLLEDYGNETLEIEQEDYDKVCEPFEEVYKIDGGSILHSANVGDMRPFDQHLEQLEKYIAYVQQHVDGGHAKRPTE